MIGRNEVVISILRVPAVYTHRKLLIISFLLPKIYWRQGQSKAYGTKQQLSNSKHMKLLLHATESRLQSCETTEPMAAVNLLM